MGCGSGQLALLELDSPQGRKDMQGQVTAKWNVALGHQSALAKLAAAVLTSPDDYAMQSAKECDVVTMTRPGWPSGWHPVAPV